MKATLQRAIRFECEKIVERHFDYLNALEEEIKRKDKRYGKSHAKEVKVPPYWQVDKGFNPFFVKASKRLSCYAHTLNKKISAQEYTPKTAIKHSIRKSDGSERELNIFQLPDAAVSRLIYKNLLSKNLHKLSSHAFAYREDRHAHDAINYIYSEWKELDRVFIAEFDFSKFFDNISHDYIQECISKLDLFITPIEQHIINAFLKSSSSSLDGYKSKSSLDIRKRGIPQGTSISLFLANVVCTELDRALERSGVGFVRYADDTIIWSQSYQKVVDAYLLIKDFSEQMNVPINMKKSEGISLLSHDGSGEIESKSFVDYLGYSINLDSISIKASKVRKIKERISYIIYSNLIQPLKRGTYNVSRLGELDKDYLVTLMQLRRYLYGGLSNSTLKSYVHGDIRKINFRGLMSYYPLVNNSPQLQTLDGWLIHTLKQSMKLRQKLWHKHASLDLPGPEKGWLGKLDTYRKWRSPLSKINYDLSIPSFTLINNAMKKSMEHYGLDSVVHPKSIYYSE